MATIPCSHRPLAALALLALLAAAPALADWCDEDGWGDGRSFCEVRETTLPAGGTIRVDAAPNGGVHGRGFDGGEVRVEARVSAHARSEERAREIVSEIRIETDGTIRAEGPRVHGREGWSVSFRLEVPRDSDLVFETTNGGVGVEGVRGDIDMRTTNGGIRLVDAGGDVRGRTTNGGISVTLTGSTWEGEGLDLRTTNGGVTIEVPEGYAADLEVGTVNGGMKFDFPVTLEGDVRRRMELELGGGGPPVRVTTTNGGFRLRRP
ncbi:MAG: hypothetical protein R3325_05960 [Thermoanaerobaculia bacterium]|nr:hypothetical protein [Thermoanaerobaculia bacterium]